MSRARRALKLAGVKRTTKRLVVTATITEYPDDKDGNKIKPDVHLNMDSGNLGVLDVRAMLTKLLAEVQQKIDVEAGHKRMMGDRMLNGTNVMAPQPLLHGGNGHGLQDVRSEDTGATIAGAAGS